MSSAEDSHAKTFPALGKGSESTEQDLACGVRWRELWARYDRVSCGWRTHRFLWDEGLPWSSVTLPRWGMMRDGVLWERITPEHFTSGTGCGFLPTPTTQHVTVSNPERTYQRDIKHSGPTWQSVLAVANRMWPTPTVCGNYNRKGASSTSGDGLATAVKNWPTPTVQDSKNNGAPSQMERNTKPLNAEVGGSLSPNWTEWLMGWPIGWTDCDASATDKSPRPWPWRGESFRSLDTAPE